jgi:hypothetical protein
MPGGRVYSLTFNRNYGPPVDVGIAPLAASAGMTIGATVTEIAAVAMAGSAALQVASTTLVAGSKMATLTDAFTTAGAPDSTKWLPYASAGVTVANSGGALSVSLPANAAIGVGGGIYSGTAAQPNGSYYDLTESYALFQMTSAGNQADTTHQALVTFMLYDQDGNDFGWAVQGNQIFWLDQDGVHQNPQPYNAATYQWLRIREHAGTTYFDYSANGNIWSNFAAVPDSTWIYPPRYLQPTFQFDSQAGSGLVAQSATFDNFNLPPAAAVPMSGTAGMTIGGAVTKVAATSLAATAGMTVTPATATVTASVFAPTHLLTAADADFETGVGSWAPLQYCNVAQTTAVAHTGSGALAITSTTATSGLTAWPTRYAVTPGQIYKASFWAMAATNARNVQCQLVFYDASLAVIAGSGGTATMGDQVGSWNQFGAPPIAVAPPNAVYAAVLFVGFGAIPVNEVHYIDTVTLDQQPGGVAALTVGAIDITGSPDLLSAESSGFEGGTTGNWSGTGGLTLTNITSQAHSGTHALQISATQPVGTVQAKQSTTIPVTPGSAYVFSGWAMAGSASLTSAFLQISWLTAAQAPISTTNGVSTPISTSAWAYLTVSDVAPPTAAYAQIQINWPVTSANLPIYWDDFSFASVLVSMGAVNVLATDDSTFEGGTAGSWINVSGTTVANTTAVASSGTHALAITATGTGGGQISTSHTLYPAIAGVSYTASLDSQAATIPRVVSCILNFYNNAGGFLGSYTSPQLPDNTWVRVTVSGVALANTAYVGVGWNNNNNVSVNGEVHYIDNVSLYQTAGALAKLSITPTVKEVATVAQSGTAGLSIDTSVTEVATAPLSANASLAVSGAQVTEVAAAPLAASAGMFVATTGLQVASITLAGGATLNISGLLTETASVAEAANASMVVTVASKTITGTPILGLALNVLVGDDSSFESGSTGTWQGQNTTVANTTAVAQSGTHSLAITATTTSGGSASTAWNLYPAIAGNTYAANLGSLAATTPRSFMVQIVFFDAGSNVVGSLNGVPATNQTGSTWTIASAQGVAPAGSVWMAVYWRNNTGVSAIGEVHYIDLVVLKQNFGAVAGLSIGTPVISRTASVPLAATTGMAIGGKVSEVASVPLVGSAALTVIPVWPKVEVLRDAFNVNGPPDPTKWVMYAPSGPDPAAGGADIPTVVNQQVQWTTGGYYTGLASAQPYTLIESHILFNLVNAGDQSVSSDLELYLMMTNRVHNPTLYNEINWYINEGKIYSSVYVNNNQVPCGPPGGVTFDPVAHAWLRFRETGGTIYFDTSADGLVWTNFASTPDIPEVAQLNLLLQAGTWSYPSTHNAVVAFDNVNNPPPVLGGVQQSATSGLSMTVQSTFLASMDLEADAYLNVKFKANTLQDNFNSGVLDPNKWWFDDVSDGYGGKVQIVNGQVNISTDLTASYPDLEAMGGYDLTESNITLELASAGNQNLASLQVWIIDAGAGWFLQNNTLTAYLGNVTEVGNPPYGPRWTGAYNPAVHKWFRVRETSGTLYWDYSPDGLAWTNAWSQATPAPTDLDMTNVYPSMLVNTGAEASTTTVIWDNYNTLPVVSAAAVVMSASAAMTTGTATISRTASVPLAASAGMTIGASITQLANVVLAGGATLNVSALVTEVAAVPMAATGSLSAAGTITKLGTVSLTATAGLTVAAAVTEQATVAMAATTGMVTSTAIIGFVIWSGSTTLTVGAQVTELAAVPLVASAALNVTVVVQQVGLVAMTASASLSVIGIFLVQFGTISLSATAGLIVGPTVKEIASVILSAQAGLTTVGIAVEIAFVSMTAQAGLVLTGVTTEIAAIAFLTATATLFSGTVEEFASVRLSAITGMTVVGSAIAIVFVFRDLVRAQAQLYPYPAVGATPETSG